MAPGHMVVVDAIAGHGDVTEARFSQVDLTCEPVQQPPAPREAITTAPYLSARWADIVTFLVRIITRTRTKQHGQGSSSHVLRT